MRKEDIEYARNEIKNHRISTETGEALPMPWMMLAEALDEIERNKPVMPALHSENDNVNNPAHYTSHPSGIECIQVTEHMSFCLGNAMKYIWRADLKNDAIEDLEKAIWYLDQEIGRRKRQANNER